MAPGRLFQRMPGHSAATPLDRLALAFLGGLTGAAYGGLLALLVYMATRQWHPTLMLWSAAVFAGLGSFFGNLVADAALALMHFLWGLACAFSEQAQPLRDGFVQGYLRTFLLLGFGTGLALLLWWQA